MKIETINPFTGRPIAEYPTHSDIDVERKIESSYKAFQDWRRRSLNERSQYFAELAKVLKRKRKDLGRLITLEMGKVYAQSLAEIDKCISTCEYYCENSEAWLKDGLISEQPKIYVTHSPIGPVLGIMPWNFPVWQVLRFAIPTLLVGNSVLIKHAPNTTGTGIEIEHLFLEAGFPSDLFLNLILDIPQVEGVIGNDKVFGVSLTGSTRAGRSVAQIAGKNLKKTVLELGGSDPYLIFDDADLDLAAEKLVNSRLANSGQSCVAPKRWIVTKNIYKQFEEMVLAILKEKQYGDPMEESTDYGPLARADLRLQLDQQVRDTVGKGVKLLLGGEIPEEQNGYLYPATLLSGVTPGTPAYHEELFGPVVSLLEAKDEAEALQIANQTVYGLGAGIFTRDIEKAEALARDHLEAGLCFVNDLVRSDPRWPFGGIKSSGYGRELGTFGLYEFSNVKTVYVQK